MRTKFTAEQLADPHIAAAEENLRACVHCGICTATCPTYVLLGDERDSPRGRIVMMQAMLEEGGAPTAETVHHIDRCLSCLGCRTACPSNVDYARLVDAARVHIETYHVRPRRERALRWLIANIMTRPALVRAALLSAKIFAPLARHLPGRLGLMADMGARLKPTHASAIPAVPHAQKRVALLRGCVQRALAPHVDAAMARVLARRDMALVPLDDAGCCGALAHHLGRAADAKDKAKRMIAAFENAGGADAFDAVVIAATGCASHMHEYGFLFLDEPEWKARADAFSAKLKDFSQIAAPQSAAPPQNLRVAYHAPCSQQNGLKLSGIGEAQLIAAGYTVLDIPEGHLCCGSAGSYSLLQPDIAGALRARKLTNIAGLRPDVIASGNIGCTTHLMGAGTPPIIHPAELVDWAEGGLVPPALVSQFTQG